MSASAAFIQSMGVAYAAGINLPATVAVLGIAERSGWIGPLPAGLGALSSIWIIGLAVTLYAFEFLVTLVPGVASLWETFQTFIRPPAAAILAVATVFAFSPVLVIAAALLGGGLALTTHGTKLGLRYAVDASPEPVTNTAANIAELGTVASIGIMIWQHPYLTITLALALLVLLILMVRRIVITLRRLFRGNLRATAATTNV